MIELELVHNMRLTRGAKQINTRGLLDTNDLVQLGAKQINNILGRLRSGIGDNDKPMRKYSKSWASVKAKMGKNPKIRDLQFSGAMLNSLTILEMDPTQNSVTVGFNRREEVDKAQENQDRTPFMISPNDREKLTLLAISLVKKKL